MTVVPLAKIDLMLDRPHYVAEAKRQSLIHLRYLLDTRSGFHGWTFEDGGHNFARALWARGNSWLTIVLPEFMELLDLERSDPPLYWHLRDALQVQCDALVPLQHPDTGLWRTLLGVPED
jgi:unsaturated rhamnogalacturonyl hydrolase